MTAAANPAQILWTHDDAIARRCRFIDVGTPRIEEPPPTEAPSTPLPNVTDEELIESLPAKVLKRDLMRAYQRLGGAEWLVQIAERSPGLFFKEVVKLIPQTINQQHDGVVRIQLSVPMSKLDECDPVDVNKNVVLEVTETGGGQARYVDPPASTPTDTSLLPLVKRP